MSRIKMQRGLKCNEDQNATRIKMHFLILSQFFNEMKKNEEESFLSSVKCRIRTVYYGLVSLYTFIDGIGDLCQHRLYMSEYMYNDGRGDLSHHRLSMSAYMFCVGKCDLCQHMLIFFTIHVD